MIPISIHSRSPDATAEISRELQAARIKNLFDDIEAQLTEPGLIEMTRDLRDRVLGSPQFAHPPAEFTVNREAWERFREHPDIIAAMGEPTLSIRARYVMQDAVKAPDRAVYMAWDDLGQELLDHGLVARTIHTDGRVTYRLTAAGKKWRAAS